MDRENVFADVLDKKKHLKTIKKIVYEKRKIRIFPKGLLHCFDQQKVSGKVLVRKSFYNPLLPPVTPCHPLSPLVTPCNPL